MEKELHKASEFGHGCGLKAIHESPEANRTESIVISTGDSMNEKSVKEIVYQAIVDLTNTYGLANREMVVQDTGFKAPLGLAEHQRPGYWRW